MSPTPAEIEAQRLLLSKEFIREQYATNGYVDDLIYVPLVFAALDAHSDTICTLADTWYPIQGSFTNNPMVGFELDGDKIVMTSEKPMYFEIDWHATFMADRIKSKIHVVPSKNESPNYAHSMGNWVKSTGEPYTMSGTVIYELERGDSIQLVVSSDGAGDVVTFNHFTTTIAGRPKEP